MTASGSSQRPCLQPAGQPRVAAWADLSPGVLHDLVRLRVDVFVVEQECPYPELDGRDVEPTTRHWWTTTPTGTPSSYLRTLAEAGGELRVGRVCTHREHRGDGLAALLLRTVLSRHAGRDVVLDAQSHLAGWYARFGFAADGPEFVEDGIPHLPMRRRP